MTEVVGVAGAAVTIETRHLPIEDGDVLILSVPHNFRQEEVEFAHRTCQQLRDELGSAGKTITTVILPDNCDLKAASRATIQELYGRLGLALMPEQVQISPAQPDQEPQIWLSESPEHEPERRKQKRKPAMERRNKPR